MSAVMTIAMVAGPLGFVAAGQILQRVSLTTMFVGVAALFTVGCSLFAAALIRGDEPVAAATLA
jgi:hypothetical protein